MKELKNVIKLSQEELNKRLESLLEVGFKKEQYIRYLSMQYYMTNGVQKHFLAVCAHESLRGKPKLRKFLYKFSMEEEPHYQIAFNDIKNSGEEPTPCPLDVKLWKLYFENELKTRPLVRLGAACILENITGGSGDLIDRLFSQTDYISKKNTVFITIHRHEDLPHGDELLDIIDASDLSQEQYEDLIEGAKTGMKMFLRCFDWALEA